mgnify:CR=1 FL=1
MPYLISWQQYDDCVRLRYSDGDVVCVRIDDFHRAFGPIVSASKNDVIRDFGGCK